MDRKIKVAHVIARIISGGADENTLLTIEGLSKEKYEIDLITGEDFDKIFFEKTNKQPINLIQVKGFKWKLNFFQDPIVLIKLVQLMKKNNYDIVHTHTTKAGILGRIAARIAKIPIIIHGLHGSTFQAFNSRLLNQLLFLFEKITGQFTDSYISVSQVLSEEYIKKGIGEKNNYYTVYSGMDLHRFYQAKERINYKKKYQALGIKAGDFVIGNVARLELRKGHRYLLEAFKNIVEEQKSKKLKLIIVGEGNQKEELEKYARKLGVGSKVIFTGYREDIEEMMALMNIFVLTSLREGLPRVLVQAAAVGMPLIAFNVDGVSEIVKDDYNGYLIQPKDTKHLVSCMNKYINKQEIMLLHSQRGREFVQDKWSIKNMISQTDKIYQTLIMNRLTGVKHGNNGKVTFG